ncbi:MAG TPA: DUF3160 domain-containing protein [Kofleriaceae bacterium]
MKSLVALSCLVVACGEQPAPKPPTPDHAGIPVIEARHAPPTCPLAQIAAGSGSDSDESPVEGVNGEGRIAKADHGGACAVADDNLARVEQAVETEGDARPAVHSKPWDHRSKPKFDALVDARFRLLPDERARLAANGFVVPARLQLGGYAQTFHELYQSQLPVYVSIDAILDAIYAGNDSLIADLEDRALAPKLAKLLDALACTLPAAAADYPADTTRDLDLYVAVARSLARGDAPISMFGDVSVERDAASLVKRATEASEMSRVALFGRDRMIDFTAYTPRGHYAATDSRRRYFRAGMWLSRLELNLVSRSSRSSQPGTVPDPSETPREDIDALALADLVGRARQLETLAALDRAWSLLAGRREDVSIPELARLRDSSGIAKLTDPDAASKLRAAIGDHFQRTARLHYMPQGSTVLPAIATLLGPRVVPDAAATRPLVNGETPDRENLGAADMGYVLGHDRAKAYLADDLAKFPTLGRQLDVARGIAAHAQRGSDDLYSAWLDAVMALAATPAGTRPSFTAAPAYADLRLNSALAAFGQLKHNFVLVAGESYFEGGCEIPDGYVEPAPATYDALLDYAARGTKAMVVLDPDDALGARSYFARLGKILGILRTIQRDELADRALTGDERAFLSMIAEMEPGTTGGPPTYTGWWFDMFRNRELDGLAPASFIASYFTGGKIAYLGATDPRLGIFVVDSGGPPRLAVGPVARAYEAHGEVQHRLDDAAATKLAETDRVAPWSASYTVAAVPEPDLHIRWEPDDGKGIELDAPSALGPVTIELFDHHRAPLVKMTKQIGAGKTVLHPKVPARTEGLHVQVGAYQAWFTLGEVEPMIDESLGKLREHSDDDE